MARLAALLLLLLALSPARAQTPPPAEEKITLSFPGNPATDFATFYQNLTGKRIILDANLQGPAMSLIVPQPVTKREAAALIESVLILNQYSLVNVDENTAKLLGPSKFARSEALPLYTNPAQLPDGDTIVSYFMPFQYLKSDEAINAFNAYIQPRQNIGGYVPVPSVNAVVVTETATVVRRLVALKDVIDVPGARTATEFFQLNSADAEKVVEILKQMFERPEDAPGARGGGNVVNQNNRPNANNGENPVPDAAPAPAAPTVAGPSAKVQVFADTRTNRILVIAPESQMVYIRSLVANLDSAVNFEQPLERPLRFVKAGDVLPVLANMLASSGDKEGASPQIVGGEGGNSGNANAANGDSAPPQGFGGAGGGGNSAISNNTTFSAENTAPQSVTVGNARIIADRSVNKIIVIGPPEARTKAAQVLDILDQRAKQVYLAVVIGQLRLGRERELGVNYYYQGSNPVAGVIRALGSGGVQDNQNLINNRNGTTTTTTDTNDAVNTVASVASSAFPVLSGLTVYGSIANSVDVLARALASDAKFQIISRPVVYTANGQSAKISSGQSVPVASGTLTSAIDTNNTTNLGSSIASNVEYKDIVLELEVQPLINSPTEVTLRIKQKNDTIEGTTTVSGNSYPTLGVQGLTTVITVPNRNTVVLGGLISEQDEYSQTGIPLLKDIPYVGYIFGNTNKERVRRELIIMIQPFIVDSDAKLAEVNRIERANTGFKGEKLFDEPMPVRPAELPTAQDLTNPKLR